MPFVDPITLEEISDKYLIEFEQLGQTFQFDIRTLARIENNINPLNRQLLPSNVISQVNSYRNLQLIYVYTLPDITTFSISKMSNVGSLILEFYKKFDINSLGNHQMEISWISCSERFKRNLYQVDLSTEIGNIVDSSECFIYTKNTERGRGSRLHTLYLYAYNHEISWLQELIPTKYHGKPPSLLEPEEIDYLLIKDFILQNREKSNTYLIRGLRKISKDSRISLSMANDILVNVQDTTMRTIVESIIMHRVIDRFNLPQDNPFYIDPYDVPMEFIAESEPSYLDMLIGVFSFI